MSTDVEQLMHSIFNLTAFYFLFVNLSLALSFASLLAPASRRSFTIVAWPYFEACIIAVEPIFEAEWIKKYIRKEEVDMAWSRCAEL